VAKKQFNQYVEELPTLAVKAEGVFAVVDYGL